MNQTNAAPALVGGAPRFFTPRLMAPWFVPAGGAGATSYYETAKLRSTLERLVDFDRINSGSVYGRRRQRLRTCRRWMRTKRSVRERLSNESSLSANGLLRESPTDALMVLSQRRCWLADRYRISLMPSATPLSMRHEATMTKDSRRFIGFGDPVLDQAAADEYGNIPETSRIMSALAEAFGGNADEDVFSGRAATIDKLVELSKFGELALCRVVCFATHAVYPRDGGSLLADPGLLFANGEILTAFDVTGLRFNADFVLLTACFTGSPSGRSIADPLSGLAQAFLVAGAQLLGTVAEALAETLSLADALARAEGHLRSSSEYAHPAFWAGFSIVGDGGLILGRQT